MKKKVIFAVATGLFALAMVFNMNVLQSNNAGDVSLESIAVMAQATPENGDNCPGGSCQRSGKVKVYNPETGGYEISYKVICSACCSTGSRPVCNWLGCRCS